MGSAIILLHHPTSLIFMLVWWKYNLTALVRTHYITWLTWLASLQQLAYVPINPWTPHTQCYFSVDCLLSSCAMNLHLWRSVILAPVLSSCSRLRRWRERRCRCHGLKFVSSGNFTLDLLWKCGPSYLRLEAWFWIFVTWYSFFRQISAISNKIWSTNQEIWWKMWIKFITFVLNRSKYKK